MMTFIKKYKDYLDKPVSKQDYNNLIKYNSEGHYLHILKEFGIKLLLIVLEFNKFEEQYRKCQAIVDTINDSNKYWGTNYKIDLSYYA